MPQDHRQAPFAHGYRRRKHSYGKVWWLLCVALGAATQVRADPWDNAPADQVWMAASDGQLSALRGGFQLGQGLMVSFGISRVAYINDRLVASTTLNLGDLNRLTAQQAGRLSQQMPLQLERSVAAQSLSWTVRPSAEPQAPLAGQEALPVPLIKVPQETVPPQLGLQGQWVQNGPGNVLQALDLPWATVIQNSLNDQVLRTQTTINVSSNGLGALRHLNWQNTLDIALRTRPGLR
jgi:hypothetical protein